MLSAARFQSLLQGVTATARKVYERVPIAEAWEIHRIHKELERGGVRLEFRVFLGCLHALKEGGLVLEPSAGMLRRTPIRERAAPAPTPAPVKRPPLTLPSSPSPMPQKATSAPVAPSDTAMMDKVGAAAARFRELASASANLARDLTTLASDVENLAIEIGERDLATAADLEKLRSLRSLLQGGI